MNRSKLEWLAVVVFTLVNLATAAAFGLASKTSMLLLMFTCFTIAMFISIDRFTQKDRIFGIMYGGFTVVYVGFIVAVAFGGYRG